MASPPRLLFGGALVVPSPHLSSDRWLDASDVRQIPDHQEVFLDRRDNGEDASLVVEILSHEAHITDSSAAHYFFQDLADANGSAPHERAFTPLSVTPVTMNRRSGTVCAGIGMQRFTMGRDFAIDFGNTTTRNSAAAPDIRTVQIELGVLRLPTVETDILITLSRTLGKGEETATTAAASELSTEFQHVLSSLRIEDWSLFSG